MAGELARAHVGDGADLIVVAGGDGTINEAAEGMIGTPVPLAILAGGHGERAGHGDEAGRQSGEGGAPVGRTAAQTDFGGTHHLRWRRGVAALSLDGGSRPGCARGAPSESGVEGKDREVRLLGGGLEPAGQAAGRIRRGDRGREEEMLFRAVEQGAELRRRFRDRAQRESAARSIRSDPVRGRYCDALREVLCRDGA